MRVGIDFRPALYGRSGVGAYVRALVRAYGEAFPDDRLRLYGHRVRERAGRRDPGPLPAGAHLCERRWPATATEALARLGLGADRLLGGVDVLHWTDYVALKATRAPVVVTLHDLLFESLPECYTVHMRRGLTRFLRRALREAARFVVPSERVRRALCLRHGVDGGRVDVVPHGTPTLASAPPESAVRPYVLLLGTLEPRKNHVRVLEALDRVRARGLEVDAVLAGARGWLDEPILSAVAARPWARLEGPVEEPRKAALLRGAAALAVASLDEGFGLPVLEGFSAGVPVLVGADTACSDLAGPAALAADPRDVAALSDALERLLTDAHLRRDLVERGAGVAAEHTWERAARATREAYRRAVPA